MHPHPRTRFFSICASVALTLLFAGRVAAHHVESQADSDASVVKAQASIERLSGTIEQLVVDDRLLPAIFRYPQLRLPDGGVLALRGSLLNGVPAGTSVELAGARNGAAFEVETLVTRNSIGNPQTKAASAPVVIEGQFRIVHADDFAQGSSRFSYEVLDDAGNVTRLELAVLPQQLRGGARVIVTGQVSLDGSQLIPSQITIVAPPPGGGDKSMLLKSSQVNTVLVIMANFSDTTAPAYTAAQAQQVMTSNVTSVANFYNEVSFGQQTLAVTVTSAWVTLNMAHPTCVDTNLSAFTTAANTAATALSVTYTASSYNYVVYVFTGLSCGWSGLAYVGFPHLAYINGTGSFVTSVVAHEIGHNFGLLHAGSLRCVGAPIGCGASGGVAEYGDPFDTMGNQRAAHFNAAQKSILGFFSASAVKTHGAGTATYTLSPIETAGGATYGVSIPTSNGLRTYWIEYRQPLGSFDNFAYPNNGAQIRVAWPFEASFGADDTELLDMTPGTATFNDAALLVGQTFTDASTGVSIVVQSATPGATGLLTVQVTTPSGTATTTTLASSANPAAVGAGVTFTAMVTGNAPTGSVRFTDAGATINGCGAVALAGAGNTRTAACTISTLTAGTHTIAAVYSGDAGNATSTSTNLTQTINGSTSTTTGLASSANPAIVGANVTFTATVNGTAPTGSVKFTDGGATIAGCGAVALGGAGNTRTAACTTNALAAGTHPVVAIYSGDSGNAGSTSATVSEVINKAASTTAVTSSINPSSFGANVTFTATVTGNAPTGNVAFSSDGGTIAGCGAVALSGAGNVKTAQCSTSTLTVGSHTIVAAYGGDAGNNASSGNLTQTVNGSGPPPTTTTVTSSANPSTVGSNVTFTAAVMGAAPTGTVAFTDNGTTIAGCGAIALTGLNSPAKTAKCTTSSLTAGSHTIVATYGGDANNNPSNANLTQTVGGGGAATTTTTIASSVNPATAGANVTFTATVTGNAPTANVAFTDNGTAIIGCSAVALTGAGNSKTAQCSTSTLTVGSHTMVAAYGGDAGNNASSGNLTQTVNGSGPPPTTTTVTSSANPSTLGSNVTFTATVTGVAPTGTVAFTDNGSTIASCSAVALSGVGNSKTAQCSTSTLTVGTHNIVATYGGDAGNAGSNGNLSQVVNSGGGQTTSTTTLYSSTNPSTVGSSVTFTAFISGKSPTGTVAFTDNGTTIPGCGAVTVITRFNARVGQCTTSGLTAGSHAIVATYSGDANNTSSNATLTQVVN